MQWDTYVYYIPIYHTHNHLLNLIYTLYYNVYNVNTIYVHIYMYVSIYKYVSMEGTYPYANGRREDAWRMCIESLIIMLYMISERFN